MASIVVEPNPAKAAGVDAVPSGELPRDPTVATERGVRVELRRQIARLEAQLGELEADGAVRVQATRGGAAPRIASVAELEVTRDSLAAALGDARRTMDQRGERRDAGRATLERAIAAPEEHRWLRIRSEDLGDPGCKHWHVKPRLGLVGMLAGWWRVKVSSGCPLACRA